jgi:hypothetical protein
MSRPSLFFAWHCFAFSYCRNVFYPHIHALPYRLCRLIDIFNGRVNTRKKRTEMPLQAALMINDYGSASGNALIGTAWNHLMSAIISGTAVMGPWPHGQASNILVVDYSGNLLHQRSRTGYRLDRQNADSGMANLSVQINGIDPPSTIASVMIPSSYYQGVITSQLESSVRLRDRELASVIRQGLTISLKSRRIAQQPNAQSGAANIWIVYRAVIKEQFSN